MCARWCRRRRRPVIDAVSQTRPGRGVSVSGWRWWGLAAAGVVSAVAITGTFVAGAGSGTETVFVPVAPCRLVDTRPNLPGQVPVNVGPRDTKIGPNSPVTFTAFGSGDGDRPCEIPSSASAISANVTIVGPTASSYLTVYPADVGSPPNASNLNFVAGQAPTPNSVTTPLSGAGAFKAFNAAGSVHVVIDVNGCFQPSTSIGAVGPTGPTGATGATGATAPRVRPDRRGRRVRPGSKTARRARRAVCRAVS